MDTLSIEEANFRDLKYKIVGKVKEELSKRVTILYILINKLFLYKIGASTIFIPDFTLINN